MSVNPYLKPYLNRSNRSEMAAKMPTGSKEDLPALAGGPGAGVGKKRGPGRPPKPKVTLEAIVRGGGGTEADGEAGTNEA